MARVLSSPSEIVLRARWMGSLRYSRTASSPSWEIWGMLAGSTGGSPDFEQPERHSIPIVIPTVMNFRVIPLLNISVSPLLGEGSDRIQIREIGQFLPNPPSQSSVSNGQCLEIFRLVAISGCLVSVL